MAKPLATISIWLLCIGKKIDCSVIGICGYEYRQLKQETVLNLFYKLHPSFE